VASNQRVGSSNLSGRTTPNHRIVPVSDGVTLQHPITSQLCGHLEDGWNADVSGAT
jgi:hypothetical protein